MNLSLELNLILVLATLDPYAGSALSEYQAGEILIQVSAVGVMPTEKFWSTTSHYADGTARTKAIPGHEFSGIVAGLGAGVTGYSQGDAVFGLNDWYAEGVLVL